MPQKITVSCPKCRAKNMIDPPPAQGGHIICQNCEHLFKIVPKNRPTSSVPTNAKTTSTSASTAPQPSPPPVKKLAKVKPIESPVTDHKSVSIPLAFNSLLNQSVNTNIEQPTTNTSQVSNIKKVVIDENLINNINNLNKNQSDNAHMAINHAMVPSDTTNQQTAADNAALNNINNLVFTLLPNAEAHTQTDVPLLLNDTIEKTDAIHAKTQFLHDQQNKLSKEFNWTLASLVALTVLIMQLFYLMAVK